MGDPTAEWQNHETPNLGSSPISLGHFLHPPWPNGKAITLQENIYVSVILTNSKPLSPALPNTAGLGSVEYSHHDYFKDGD